MIGRWVSERLGNSPNARRLGLFNLKLFFHEAPMFRSLLSAAALSISTVAATLAPVQVHATGHGCQTVRFPSGAYAHAVQGYVTGQASQCWYLSVRAGQQARVRILEGSSFFTTTHTNGSFQDVRFATLNGDLYVYVHSSSGSQQRYVIEFVFV